MLLEFWPAKMVFSAMSAMFCYLFGGSEAVLLVVAVFVVLDTLTKWTAIIRRYMLDSGITAEQISFTAYLCGFVHAWKPGYLTSTALRQCLGEKIFTYAILIIFASLMGKLPEINVASVAVNKSISGGIYAYIAMTELLSITENLEDMGNSSLAQFKQYVCKLSDKITGGTYSVNFKSGGNDTGNKDGN